MLAPRSAFGRAVSATVPHADGDAHMTTFAERIMPERAHPTGADPSGSLRRLTPITTTLPTRALPGPFVVSGGR